MKKALIIISGIFLLLLMILIILPFVFKKKIEEKVKSEINTSVNAVVTWSSFDLTLIRTFPDLTFELNDLAISGINEFKNDTLAQMENLKIGINLWDVISGSRIKINSIELIRPVINVIVLKDGKANYDIVKSDSDRKSTRLNSSHRT